MIKKSQTNKSNLLQNYLVKRGSCSESESNSMSQSDEDVESPVENEMEMEFTTRENLGTLGMNS